MASSLPNGLTTARPAGSGSDKLEALSRLAAGVAHDFGNLLSAINGFSQLLVEDITDERQREQVEQILVAGQRAARLLDQLRAFSQRQLLRPEVVDVGVLLAEQHKLLSRLVAADVSLEVSIEPDVEATFVDRNQLRKALVQLVVFAGDVAESGGLLGLRLRPARVSDAIATTGRDPRDFILLRCLETGRPLDAGRLERVFDPYGEGADDLGLAAVYGIVKQSRGEVFVRGTSQGGCCFELYLPTARSLQDRTPSPIPPNPSVLGSERILVHEEDAAVRMLAQQVLERHGYRVVLAATADEAADAVQAHPDLAAAIVELSPRLAGPDLTRRWVSEVPALRLVYLAGFDDLAVAPNDGSMIVVEKPFVPRELLVRLREALDGEVCHPSVTARRADGRDLAEVVWDRLSALVADRDVRRQVMGGYLRRGQELVQALELAMGRDGSLEVARAARELRESAAVFGAAMLVVICQEIEEQASRGRIAREQLAGAWTAHEELVVALKTLTNR